MASKANDAIPVINSRVISSATLSIMGSEFNDLSENSGVLNGNVSLRAGDDTDKGEAGSLDGELLAGNGNDVITDFQNGSDLFDIHAFGGTGQVFLEGVTGTINRSDFIF